MPRPDGSHTVIAYLSVHTARILTSYPTDQISANGRLQRSFAMGVPMILDAMPFPEAICSSKRREAAFGGDARAGEDDDRRYVVHHDAALACRGVARNRLS